MKRAVALVVTLFLFAIAAIAQSAPSQAVPNSDVYHLHFAKAALGQSKALENQLKTPDPKALMPGHRLVLRHQSGDDWDFLVIEHLGTKVTIDPTQYTPPAPGAPATEAWHSDTFVTGPSWDVVAKQLGISKDAGATATSVYVVANWRAASGHRDQLGKALATRDATSKEAGNLVVAHIEGGPWTYLTVTRFNSWQDFGASEAASQDAQGWHDIRDHGSWHHDTITTRVATAGAASK